MSIDLAKPSLPRLIVPLVCLVGLAVVGGVTKNQWLPLLQAAQGSKTDAHDAHDHEHDDHAHDDHAHDHDHDHATHGETLTIELSEKGLKNIGYKPFPVSPASYNKKLTLPAIVVERPGRSQIHITAPLTGVVTKIHAVSGEAIGSGQPLFEIRLTHGELVTAQREFLRTAKNLDIVNHEIKRLRSLDEGVIAGRRILEKEYEKQKLEASLHAGEQAIRHHGITAAQVKEILSTRELFETLTIKVPEYVHNGDYCRDCHFFQVQRLNVALGEHVKAGRELAILADHCELHLEGLAFEDDAPLIRKATEAGRPVSARLLGNNVSDIAVPQLEVLYVAGQIDPNSRAFKIYLRLPNEVAFDKTTSEGKRYVEWRFKPGQRMQLSVPIETWEKQLVLPPTAIVDEGAEAYAYRQNGDHFDQVAVHVLHRDQDSVVVSNDGALFQSDIIAGVGAYQMHLALKNQSGGGIDPHAGHSH